MTAHACLRKREAVRAVQSRMPSLVRVRSGFIATRGVSSQTGWRRLAVRAVLFL